MHCSVQPVMHCSVQPTESMLRAPIDYVHVRQANSALMLVGPEMKGEPGLGMHAVMW